MASLDLLVLFINVFVICLPISSSQPFGARLAPPAGTDYADNSDSFEEGPVITLGDANTSGIDYGDDLDPFDIANTPIKECAEEGQGTDDGNKVKVDYENVNISPIDGQTVDNKNIADQLAKRRCRTAKVAQQNATAANQWKNSTSSADDNTGTPDWIICTVALTSVVTVLIILIIVSFYCRWKRSKRQPSTESKDVEMGACSSFDGHVCLPDDMCIPSSSTKLLQVVSEVKQNQDGRAKSQNGVGPQTQKKSEEPEESRMNAEGALTEGAISEQSEQFIKKIDPEAVKVQWKKHSEPEPEAVKEKLKKHSEPDPEFKEFTKEEINESRAVQNADPTPGTCQVS